MHDWTAEPATAQRTTKRRTLLMFCAERFQNPTRVLSPRQLPTDHDHAVSTREYQSDQSSRLPLGCCRPCCPELCSKLTSRNVFPLRRPSRVSVHARTVLAVQGYATPLRALDCSAPFWPARSCDGRLRREHFHKLGGAMKKKRPAPLLAERSQPDSKPAKPGGA